MDPFKRQRRASDCGAAALAALLKLLGKTVPYADLLMAAGTTDSRGTSSAGIMRAMKELKVKHIEMQFEDRADAWSWASALGRSGPAILSFDRDEHWVLLVAGYGSRVLVFDPEVGTRVMGRQALLKRWSMDGRFYAIRSYARGNRWVT